MQQKCSVDLSSRSTFLFLMKHQKMLGGGGRLVTVSFSTKLKCDDIPNYTV